MPRKPVWPPKIRVRNGYAFVRLTLHGVRRDFHLGAADSPAARDRYRDLLAEVERSGTLAPPGRAGLSVTELCEWWASAVGRFYRLTSREPLAFRPICRLVTALFGPVPARDFGPKHLRQFRDALVRQGLCRAVVNRRTTRVKTLFRRAAEEELVPGSVCHNLAAVRALPPQTPGVPESAPPAVATWDQVKAVICHCPRAVRAMLLLQWFTGMRSGEVRTLRTVEVEVSGDVWLYRPAGHKNAWRGQPRIVAIGPRAQKILRHWLNPTQPDAHCFRGRSGCYSDVSYARAVRRAADAAGVDLHPYALRHAFKARALAVGTITDAMAAMGQRSSAAFDRYGGADVGAASHLARKIG